MDQKLEKKAEAASWWLMVLGAGAGVLLVDQMLNAINRATQARAEETISARMLREFEAVQGSKKTE